MFRLLISSFFVCLMLANTAFASPRWPVRAAKMLYRPLAPVATVLAFGFNLGFELGRDDLEGAIHAGFAGGDPSARQRSRSPLTKRVAVAVVRRGRDVAAPLAVGLLGVLGGTVGTATGVLSMPFTAWEALQARDWDPLLGSVDLTLAGPPFAGGAVLGGVTGTMHAATQIVRHDIGALTNTFRHTRDESKQELLP